MQVGIGAESLKFLYIWCLSKIFLGSVTCSRAETGGSGTNDTWGDLKINLKASKRIRCQCDFAEVVDSPALSARYLGGPALFQVTSSHAKGGSSSQARKLASSQALRQGMVKNLPLLGVDLSSPRCDLWLSRMI